MMGAQLHLCPLALFLYSYFVFVFHSWRGIAPFFGHFHRFLGFFGHWTFVSSLNILPFGALHRREVEKGPPFVLRPWGTSSLYSQTFL